MGYGNPKTLSDINVRNCQGDIKEFKPTIMVGVPAVWETVKKGILNNVSKGGSLVKNVFWGGMSTKKFLLSSGLPGSSIIDAIVFKKLKVATGGRLRVMLNGGGPINKDTQHFLSMAVCPMIGGYGLTETAAMGAINDPKTWNPNAIGEITASIEMKLVDFEEAGYFTKNKPPQGEIWIRGGSVIEGYFMNDEETKAAFTSDGWFMTGDIGEFDKYGHIKVIDRKKNLVKTLNGEYIALEKLESIYRSVPVVGNMCVFAATDQVKPVAIIVPAEPALIAMAKQHGIKGDTIETLVHDKKLNTIILKELQTAGRAAGLKPFEIINGVVLSDEEWTPQNVSAIPFLAPMHALPSTCWHVTDDLFRAIPLLPRNFNGRRLSPASPRISIVLMERAKRSVIQVISSTAVTSTSLEAVLIKPNSPRFFLSKSGLDFIPSHFLAFLRTSLPLFSFRLIPNCRF